ncbi:MAG: glucose-6-phosphate isomerase [Patescibacteria group bacterium]
MQKITLNTSGIENFIKKEEVLSYQDKVSEIDEGMNGRTGEGADFLGWLDLPKNIDQSELDKILKAADKIRSNSDAVVVIGIGGSYLGAKAVIEALKSDFYNSLSKEERGGPEIYFAGNNVSGSYLKNLLKVLENKDISVISISKSGTTLEPATAFRIFKQYLLKKYGDGARERIFVITDKEKGVLKNIADEEKYESFIIPDNIGGRYSVFTPVGLLPIAVAGIDVQELISGAKDGCVEYENINIEKNPAYLYAVIRNILNKQEKGIEILSNFEPSMHYFSEWWKQLFGESEGKGGKGIFPASVDFTTDLHSLGQLIQDGKRNVFETFLSFQNIKDDVTVSEDEQNLDNLNYLSGKTLNYINKQALLATVQAHIEGGVPSLIFEVPELNPYYLGKLLYLFERSCAMSAYLSGVNPFNQPGVEAYKKKMFSLLGK